MKILIRFGVFVINFTIANIISVIMVVGDIFIYEKCNLSPLQSIYLVFISGILFYGICNCMCEIEKKIYKRIIDKIYV